MSVLTTAFIKDRILFSRSLWQKLGLTSYETRMLLPQIGSRSGAEDSTRIKYGDVQYEINALCPLLLSDRRLKPSRVVLFKQQGEAGMQC